MPSEGCMSISIGILQRSVCEESFSEVSVILQIDLLSTRSRRAVSPSSQYADPSFSVDDQLSTSHEVTTSFSISSQYADPSFNVDDQLSASHEDTTSFSISSQYADPSFNVDDQLSASHEDTTCVHYKLRVPTAYISLVVVKVQETLTYKQLSIYVEVVKYRTSTHP